MTEAKELPAPHEFNNEIDWHPRDPMVWPKEKPLVRVRLSQGLKRGDIVTNQWGEILVILGEAVPKRSVQYMNKIYLGEYHATRWFGDNELCTGPGDWRSGGFSPSEAFTKIGELGPHDRIPNSELECKLHESHRTINSEPCHAFVHHPDEWERMGVI